ncbi:MAG: 1-deoxy-D-xylulose-5-phosphate synthase, partial [Chloroflexi bacterium]|nr:1-deoxy-D-xylulose-5-phosphate synthase [Chloroflexota bacterium]
MIRPFIEKENFDTVINATISSHSKMKLLADMTRLNTLTAVKEAGSGHLGTSFSSAEIVTYLYHSILNINAHNLNDPHRNIYFSSKGHDVPFQYATLYALGIISKEKLLLLRKLGGLDGHPDIGIDGIEANSGSLGMGISKAAGMAWAKHYLNLEGALYVVTGDGEFQEGQNFEALQFSVSREIRRLTVIMDHNKVQSDKYVEEILSLGNLKAKIQEFGWKVLEIDGHNFDEIENALR